MAGRRGNSEGTIRKRADGRWEARLVLTNGTRKSLYGKTRHEVAGQLAQAIRDRGQGIEALGERQTVGEYLTSWIETEAYRIKRGSCARYAQEVRLRLIPGLGKVVLIKLTAQQVSASYARELQKGTSATSVRYCHTVLHAALEDALKQGLVYRNVAHLVDPPRKLKHQMGVYTEEQVRTLLQVATGDRLEALCLLVLATGMRMGELLALTWEDVNLARGTVMVRTTLQRHRGEGLVAEEAKTDHSKRVIALPSVAQEAFSRHRARQNAEREQLGATWNDLNLVFPNTIGRPMEPNSLRYRWWYRLVRRAGLPQIRFHDLRHTAATLLLARGVPVKVVSEMLGHASVSITLNLYGHVLPHMQQQAAETMDAVLRADVSQGSKLGSSDGE